MEGFSVKASSVLVLATLLLSSSSCSTRSLKNPLLPFFPPWPLLWALCAHQGWAFGLASAHPQCSELRPLWLFSHSAPPLVLSWTVSFLPLLWKHPSVPHNCWRGLRTPSGYYSSLHTRALQDLSSGAPFRIHKHIFSGCAQLLSGLVGF